MVSVHRRSFLGLLTATALPGCNALGSSPSCSVDTEQAVTGWPLPDRDPQNTAAIPGGNPVTFEDASVAWSAEWDRRFLPSVVSSQTLVLPSRRVDTRDPSDTDPPPAVFALDPMTGEKRWRTDIRYEPDPGLGSLTRSVALGHGQIYVVQDVHPSDTPNRLLALDEASGERLWTHEGIQADGLHLGAGVVLAATEQAVRIVEPETGETCRTMHVQGPLTRLLEDRELVARPAVVGSRLFICAAAPRKTPNEPGHYWLSGIDLTSGEVNWTSDRFTVNENLPEAVIADDDRVYLPVGNRIRAFDHAGTPQWNTPVSSPNPDHDGWPYVWKMALAGSQLVVNLATYEAPNEYYALDSETGEIQWRRDELWRQPIVAGDIVYAMDRDGTVLHALDLVSGETRGTYRFDGPVRYPPRVVDGRLFALIEISSEEAGSRYRMTVLN